MSPNRIIESEGIPLFNYIPLIRGTNPHLKLTSNESVKLINLMRGRKLLPEFDREITRTSKKGSG